MLPVSRTRARPSKSKSVRRLLRLSRSPDCALGEVSVGEEPLWGFVKSRRRRDRVLVVCALVVFALG